MTTKETTVEIVNCKRATPQIRAVQIPATCSMADADVIERAFPHVKRSAWSARTDTVSEFEVEMPTFEKSKAKPGRWIVEVFDPHADRLMSMEVLDAHEFVARYKVKG